VYTLLTVAVQSPIPLTARGLIAKRALIRLDAQRLSADHILVSLERFHDGPLPAEVVQAGAALGQALGPWACCPP